MFFHFHPATSHQGTTSSCNILNIDFLFYIFFSGKMKEISSLGLEYEKKKMHTSASKTFEGGFTLRVPQPLKWIFFSMSLLIHPSQQLYKDVSSAVYGAVLLLALCICLRLDVLEMKPTRVQQTPQIQSRVAI